MSPIYPTKVRLRLRETCPFWFSHHQSQERALGEADKLDTIQE